MKILLINTYDSGGAANSCFRLHHGLLKSKIDSNVLLKYKSGSWPKSSCFSPQPNNLATFDKLGTIIKKIGRKLNSYKPLKEYDKGAFLRSRSKVLEMFSFPYSNLDITKSFEYQEADIINLHWVANFVDYTSFFKKNTKPVVWTLHDMNPFSGGVHFKEIFLGIDDEGFPVPRIISKEEREAEFCNLQLKKRALADVNNLTIVAPSIWLANEAKQSEVFRNKQIIHIPYGLDPKVFKPKSKRHSRTVLGIPEDKKVFLFVADSIAKERKGFQYLKRSIEELSNNDIFLCSVGSNSPIFEQSENYLPLGRIDDVNLLCMAYSAADAFIIPSIMDNLPNTVLESLMCGTPVIGFPVGGIPEMIQNDINGIVCKELSVSSLTNAIKQFINIQFNRQKIRKGAIKKYSHSIQAEEYRKLFQKILSTS